jgi:hypothetical protein
MNLYEADLSTGLTMRGRYIPMVVKKREQVLET